MRANRACRVEALRELAQAAVAAGRDVRPGRWEGVARQGRDNSFSVFDPLRARRLLGDLWRLFEKDARSCNAISATPLKNSHGQSR